jgi:hypothetical protein
MVCMYHEATFKDGSLQAQALPKQPSRLRHINSHAFHSHKSLLENGTWTQKIYKINTA